MATITERLRWILEVDSKSAVAGFDKVGKSADKSIANAQTSSEKFRKSMVKTGALVGGVGITVGVAAFGIANKFKDLALAAGKFADTTKMSVQDASKWIEVSSKWGIQASEMTVAFDKLNKAIAAGKLGQYGMEVKRAADGSTDLNATFLSVVDTLNAMPDSAKRAEAAAAVLGRGWHSLAELVGAGSAQLRKELDDVTDAQIITPEELAKADKFRAQMDELNDNIGDLANTLGEALLPVLGDFVDALNSLKPVYDVAIKLKLPSLAFELANYPGQMAKIIQGGLTGDFGEGWGGVARRVGVAIVTGGGSELVNVGRKMGVKLWHGLANEWRHSQKEEPLVPVAIDLGATAPNYAAAMQRFGGGKLPFEFAGDAAREMDAANDVLRETATRLGEMRGAAMQAAAGIRAIDTAWQAATGTLTTDNALRNVQDQFDKLTDTKFENTEAGVRDLGRTINDTKLAVADYLQTLGDVPPEKATKLLAEIDKGQFYWVEQQLAILTRNRDINLQLQLKGAVGYLPRYGKNGAQVRGAEGGIVTKPTPALIGEAGPEAVVPLHRMPGASRLPRGGSAVMAPVFNITVHAATGNGYDIGRSIVEEIKRYERAAGTGWRN